MRRWNESQLFMLGLARFGIEGQGPARHGIEGQGMVRHGFMV